MAKTNGIEKLRNVMEHWHTGSLVDWCRGVAGQIERERADALNKKTATICRQNAEIAQLRADLAAKRELTDEDRDLVERLRALGPMPTFGKLCEAVAGTENCTYGAVRDRLIELIEHGGKQDVDVAALREVASAIELYVKARCPIDVVCAASYAERIRMAIDGAPEQSNIVALCKPCRTKRDAAADWVEQQGGLDEVKHHYAFVVERIAERVGVERGSDEPEHVTIGKVIEELDKRLMPHGMEWPRFEDGERVPLDYVESPMWAISYETTTPSSSWWCTGVEMRKRGEVVIHASDGDRDAATISLKRGQRVKRTEPEVLGADGLPIKVGETVYALQGEGPLTVSGYDGEFLKIESGGLLRTDYAAHTPPETQARINSDAKLKPVPYVRDVLKRENWDRVTERQAYLFMVADLLHRQRELDAKTMGGE